MNVVTKDVPVYDNRRKHMFTPTYDRKWLQQKIVEGDDGFINAGGMRTELSGNLTAEPLPASHSQRKAFAKFVELSRRKKQMSQPELAEKIQVDVDEIIEIEDESFVSVEPSTIYALAQEFEIPAKTLMAVAGLTQQENKNIREASIRFAANSGNKSPLQPDEDYLLEIYVNALISMR